MSYTYASIGVTRTHGDANGVVVMDIGIAGASSLGVPIVTGIGKEVNLFKILVKNNGATAIDLHQTGAASEMQTGATVEAILKVVAQLVTVLMYQVENDTSGQISILVEQKDAWSDTGTTNDYGFTIPSLQAAIRALGATVGLNSIDVRGTTVLNEGFKLA